MDICSTFDMSRITGITSTNSINSEKAQGDSFVSSLGAVNNSNESPHQKALMAFYQVHQLSQITSVPTSEYNGTIAALDLDKGHSFATANMLNRAGFDTGMPSVAAIWRYGNTSNTSVGNLSFLKGGAVVLAKRAKVGIIPATLETKKIPLAATSTGAPKATASETFAPTRNFYDATVAMSAQPKSTQLKHPINQVARQVNSTNYQIIEK